MTSTVAILGSGAWGTAMAVLLADRCRAVLWCRSAQRMREIADRGENSTYLPGVPLPGSVELSDLVPPADLYLVAIPTQHIRSTLEGLKLDRSTAAVSLAKGIEISTLSRPSEILSRWFDRVSALSGPSMAPEVARGLPTSVVVAGADADRAQRILMGPSFRVYTSRDLIGVELGGALKNVITLAAGICDGLRLGDNAKASLITRGVVEMARFGASMGAEPQTFFGLAGIGDLITSCTSPLGRNLYVGRQIGEGRRLEEVLRGMVHVPEGVWTCRAVEELARKRSIEMPIAAEIFRILYEGKDPRAAIRDLMTRTPKAE
jgi:glycerol-3-phosphate dehydrogenase (NAD(P)+)